jgi:type III secretion protein L
MFVRRVLSFNPQHPSLAEPVLRRECFESMPLASEWLARAEATAKTIVNDAQVQARSAVADARAEFWVQANQVLQGWEVERQAQREAIVEQVRQLLSQTLASLLGTFTGEERTLALIRQIDQGQRRPAQGTMRCADDIYLSVEAVLLSQPHAHWMLERDSGLSPGALVLSTAAGDFALDWERLSELLLNVV